MKKSLRKVNLIVVFSVVIFLVFVTAAIAQRVVPNGAAKPGKGQWVVLTYDFVTGAISYPLATPIRGGGVSFNFYPTPDRAMLLVDDLYLIQQFHGGNLAGKTLSAKISIEATSDATFNYYNNNGTGSLIDLPWEKWADPGGFVRLYFNKVNTPGCPTGYHSEYPDCEAQYWWSNPVHIELQDLAALGSKGITLEVPLKPEFWSDRDGHMGTDTTPIDHIAAFNAAVANVKKIGLSFGGNGWWGFGCGVTTGNATFKLLKFVVKGN